MRFSFMSIARSPRMVPGAASLGLVAPIRFRTTFQVSSGPSTTSTSEGPRVMKATGFVEGLSHRARRSGARRSRSSMVRSSAADDTQLLALEAADDLADESPLDAVGFHDDQGSIHEEAI